MTDIVRNITAQPVLPSIHQFLTENPFNSHSGDSTILGRCTVMKKKIMISNVAGEEEACQKRESGAAAMHVSIALSPEDASAKPIVNADDTEKFQRLVEKLERFLERACKAEEKKDYCRAARAYALALYCEGMLQTDVDNGCAYVRQAMPIY